MKRVMITLTLVLIFATASIMAQPGMGRGSGQDFDCNMQGHMGGKGMHGSQGMRCGQGMHGSQGMRGGKGGGALRMLRMADELELTERQIDQIKEMSIEFQTELVDAHAALKKTQIQLRALHREKDASERELFGLIDEAAAQKAEVKKLHVAHRNSMRDLLTAEQQEKMESLREERREQRPGKTRERRHSGQRSGHGL